MNKTVEPGSIPRTISLCDSEFRLLEQQDRHRPGTGAAKRAAYALGLLGVAFAVARALARKRRDNDRGDESAGDRSPSPELASYGEQPGLAPTSASKEAYET